MRDAYLILEHLSEDPGNTNTSDDKPATRAHARIRLARMIAAESSEFDARDAVAMAQAAAQAQAALLAGAVRKVSGSLPAAPECMILSGHGEFLAREALDALQLGATRISLAQKIGPAASRCGPAHALAVIARESTTSLN